MTIRKSWLPTLALGLTGIGIWVSTRPASRPPASIRIGYHDTKPFLFSSPEGPVGFAYDVLTLAAERHKLNIAWVYVPEGAAKALQTGRIDLWPRSTVTEGIASAPYVTEPWFYDAYGLVVPNADRSRRPIQYLAGKRVSVGPTPFQRALAVRALPGMEVRVAESPDAAVELVCTGGAEAAFVDQRHALTRMARGTLCDSGELSIHPVPGTSFRVGIGSTKGMSAVADELRDVIVKMIESGEIRDIYSRWYISVPSELQAIGDAMRLERANRFLTVSGLLLFACALGLLGTTVALYRARRMAERASSAKSTFLGAMGHEFRTPLNGILGSSQLLERSRLDPEQRSLVQQIALSAEWLKLTTGNIFDFTKLESGQLTLLRSEFSIEEVVRGAVGSLSEQLRSQGTDAVIDLDAALPKMVVGDGGRVQQVLANLCGNAVAATRGGTVTVRVKVVERFGQTATVRFAVIDTGEGIEAEQLPLLFEAFTQVDEGSTRRREGVGLGLAISGKLVTAMGGRIFVESQPGTGSHFWFDLPFAVQSVVRGEAATPRRGLRVLVAEDNRVNQVVIVGALKKLGHFANVANDGQEAVELFQREPWDLVLMDCHMPRMDGAEATRLIRKAEETRAYRTPIIAVTASVSDEERMHCMELGIADILEKPVDLATLARCIQKHQRSESASEVKPV